LPIDQSLNKLLKTIHEIFRLNLLEYYLRLINTQLTIFNAMKLCTILAPLFLVIFLAGSPKAGEEISFSWAFFLKEDPGRLRSLSFEGSEPVEGGDLLRIYLELHQRSHVYLYLHDARQDLYLVFPPGPKFYSGEFPSWQKSYIPSGRDWFTLDGEEGVERFYLLASNRRLVEMEELTSRFINDGNNDLKEQLLTLLESKVKSFSTASGAEIGRVPVQHSKSLSTSVTQPKVEANRVVATGDYGMVLELVNR
jgi:hypothetical protein